MCGFRILVHTGGRARARHLEAPGFFVSASGIVFASYQFALSGSMSWSPMPQDYNQPPSPPCLTCGKLMTLAHIVPKVASFPELHTFRCRACGDVRTIEQETR